MDASVSRQYPEVANVKWEYTNRQFYGSELHEIMNGMGEDGWEAWHIKIEPESDHTPEWVTVYFKRPYVMVGPEDT